MTKASEYFGSSGPQWWETPGSLGTALLWLDGRVGTMVNAEKQVAALAVVSGDLARHLGRTAQQMGLSTGNGMAGHSDRALVFEPVKPGFTREAGSIRGQVPQPGVQEPGE